MESKETLADTAPQQLQEKERKDGGCEHGHEVKAGSLEVPAVPAPAIPQPNAAQLLAEQLRALAARVSSAGPEAIGANVQQALLRPSTLDFEQLFRALELTTPTPEPAPAASMPPPPVPLHKLNSQASQEPLLGPAHAIAAQAPNQAWFQSPWPSPRDTQESLCESPWPSPRGMQEMWCFRVDVRVKPTLNP